MAKSKLENKKMEDKPTKIKKTTAAKPDKEAIITLKKKEEVVIQNIEPQIIIPLDEKIEKNKTQQKNIATMLKCYSDEDLDMFHAVIDANKTEALDELRMLKERLDDLNSSDLAEESMVYSVHMGEQGSEAIEKEKIYAQIQRISEYIQKLNEAMSRIEDKTYGICRVCGCLIAKERLLAVPVTTLSASYKIHQKCPEDGVDKIEAIK